MLYTLILLQLLHSMTVHRDLQINHTDNMFQLYYTESVKFCFKYTYASFHSSGLIVSLSGMMRSRSSLNSSVRKSSGMLKTPDSIATVTLCHVPVIALLAFDSCVNTTSLSQMSALSGLTETTFATGRRASTIIAYQKDIEILLKTA